MGLKELRAQIDKLDEDIVKLLNKRAEVVKRIGELKNKARRGVYSPEREKQIYDRICSLNKGPLPDRVLKAIYREIMSGSLSLEKAIKICYLGPSGTFTHQAAKSKFGESVEYVPVKSIDEVFGEVAIGRADYGVVPVENSTEGNVGETLHMFMDTDLKICSEILLRIHHNLMARCKFEQIKKVYSRPQVFGQCKAWLSNNMPNVELCSASSTTQAAQLARSERYSAAIAHEEAARIYGLEILRHHIEDSPHNATRFLVLGHEIPKPTGADKTSIICSIRNRPGALVEILMPFKEHNINLTQVVPWPSKRRAWDYCFFIDFEGHHTNRKISKALREVEEKCTEMKILGSYPRATEES